MKRAALAGEVDSRSSSLNHWCCSGVPPGMNWRGEELAERRVGLAPAEFGEAAHHLGLLALGIRAAAHQPPARVAARQHQVRDPLRVARRELDRDRRALRDAEQGDALDAEDVDDGLEVEHPALEADFRHDPVRQAAAALVVAHEVAALRQVLEQVAPDRALPVVLEVRQPGRRLDDRRTLAAAGPGQAHAVVAAGKADLLHGHAGPRLAEILRCWLRASRTDCRSPVRVLPGPRSRFAGPARARRGPTRDRRLTTARAAAFHNARRCIARTAASAIQPAEERAMPSRCVLSISSSDGGSAAARCPDEPSQRLVEAPRPRRPPRP